MGTLLSHVGPRDAVKSHVDFRKPGRVANVTERFENKKREKMEVIPGLPLSAKEKAEIYTALLLIVVYCTTPNIRLLSSLWVPWHLFSSIPMLWILELYCKS